MIPIWLTQVLRVVRYKKMQTFIPKHCRTCEPIFDDLFEPGFTSFGAQPGI